MYLFKTLAEFTISLGLHGVGSYIGAAILLCSFYFICSAIYTIYFHPLSKFPGPKRAIVSNLFYSRTVVSGKSAKILKSLHDKYGNVVRWAPNELSFACADAWKDVYDRRKDGKVLLKDPKFYVSDDTIRAKHLVSVIDPEEHYRMRKALSHGFSAKALLEEEEVILHYANDLMEAVKEKGSEGPINLVEFFNWTTFDVLGDLAFGEPFDSLKNRKTDSWIAIVLDSVTFTAWDIALLKLPYIHYLQSWLTPKHIREAAAKHVNESKKKILAREAKKTNRKDFVSYIIKLRDEMKLTDWDMAAHGNLLIIAGSETTATTLSGAHYYLMKNPDAYEKLKTEIRSTFKSHEEINARSAGSLPYLTACIEETLRIYPAVPIGTPRIVPNGGCDIAGYHVPSGTTVGVHMWSTTRNPENFTEPDKFLPERWINPIAGDRLDASKPFLLGPRMCLGVNMAWIELRVIIAKMTFLYDLEIVDRNLDWSRDQECYVLWQKPNLFAKVTPAGPRNH